jgi:hypothetical protein
MRIRDLQRAHCRSNDGPAQSGAAVHAATHDRWAAVANRVVAAAAPRKNRTNSLAIVGRGVGQSMKSGMRSTVRGGALKSPEAVLKRPESA